MYGRVECRVGCRVGWNVGCRLGCRVRCRVGCRVRCRVRCRVGDLIKYYLTERNNNTEMRIKMLKQTEEMLTIIVI